jgi:LmbE family N-acetylglucosaminyl deacetylase
MNTETFVPDGVAEAHALARTTHMGVVAHPDDLEILAQPGILDCFGRNDRWFCGVVVTDGAGSPRSGPYADVSDGDMVQVRRHEQRKAAVVGEYGAVVMVGVTSAEVKDPSPGRAVRELTELLRRARPEVLYTHNLADRHDTHVAVALRTIEACRALPAAERPRRLLGGEVWRDLDWLAGDDRQVVDVSTRENVVAALIGVFDSQITGGKRYDLALLGRRRAHATFDESHHTDTAAGAALYLDMTPLLQDASLEPAAFLRERIDRFAAEVDGRLARLGGRAAGRK